MPRTQDVVVVGGGIIGLAIAREAAKAGLRVVVLEKGKPGREASTAAAGILSAQLEADRRHALLPLLLHSQGLYRSFVRMVESESGIDCGLRLRGTIEVARTPVALARLGRRLAFQRSQGLAVERLSGRELRRLEPGIAPGCHGGLLYPRDGSVDNALLVRALVRAARRAGTRILPRTSATRLLVEHGRVVGVAAGAVRYPAGAVVIAAGAWSGSIRGAGVAGLPTHPVRGQILCLRTEFGGPRRVLHTEEAYLVPRAGGRVLVGSTMERVGFRRAVTAGALAALARAAVALVPTLRGARVLSAWAGFRPATADGLPAIGPAAAPGLHYATGHLRHGILLAPATARVLVRILVGQDPGIELAPFSPRRFSA